MKRKKMKGKSKISKMFKILEKGDKVAVIIEPSEKFSFPKQLQGRTGNIESKRGKAYIVKITEKNKSKKYIIEPVHLKKLI